MKKWNKNFDYSFLITKRLRIRNHQNEKSDLDALKNACNLQLLSMTYIVDVDPDGGALQGVDELVILEVLAEDLARHHVVEQNLQGRK